MDRKQAFKMGFVLKLASEGVGVKELLEAGEVLEKYAAKGLPAGMPVRAAGSPVGAATGLAALGLGAGYFVPSFAGTVAGTTAGDLVAEEYDSVRMAKKRYLIRRLRQMVAAAKQKERNRVLSSVVKEKPSDREERQRYDGPRVVAGE